MEIRQNVIDDLNAMTTESWRTIQMCIRDSPGRMPGNVLRNFL